MTQNYNRKIFYAISFAMQLGFMISITILGFLWIGYFIDKTFNTHPIFIILGIVIGAIMVVYDVFYLLNSFLKD
ncbi:hypothetical protein COV24_01525 [candidate division WWE3 bacterium CG10_big_fil_rev_8_21_14_0_10_32_10]|uniref:AtpZ/AtpI family protein n=1 Tax=candidate division WWE3 bacterium CG10_big_fil_rev_8_21_14_0_10_32_10 TaxID=1975090 RepID=A0A2H0RD20_UNCKA|nr:MAG: hypothetical protein COV24_01525 [candidate division WWE3 bacterium CG10_big_fil_rev_8_21_14_0_10_32_10]